MCNARTGASVNWVLLSDHGWGSGAFMHDTLVLRRPAEVHFPAYQQSQLLTVRSSRKTLCRAFSSHRSCGVAANAAISDKHAPP